MNWDLIKEKNLRVNNDPFVIKNFLDPPDQFVSWEKVNSCLYRRDMNWEIISNSGFKTNIPQIDSVWYGIHQDPIFIFDKIRSGSGFVISKYGRFDDKTNQFLYELESNFYSASDIHVYGGLGNANSFNIHCDETCNFIIQVEGTTPWVVYKNSYSFVSSIDSYFPNESEVVPELEVELSPGDLLYIPAWRYHKASPRGNRLSMSIAMMQRYFNTPTMHRESLLTITP